ncbi:MAG: DUF1573 domain-containing protein [Sphingobacteriaceae bacterium]|nr:DUF1573 domain-containing protein [Sphingobacteriaceae bacterium]
MKKLLTICAVIISFVAITAMKTGTEAEFKFESESHDFAKIPQAKPVTFEFKFTNIGDQPLIISNVESTCGCTVPEYSKTPIKKGESGIIKASFNAAAPGPFIKQLTVRSNARTPIKVLIIKGEVVAASSK